MGNRYKFNTKPGNVLNALVVVFLSTHFLAACSSSGDGASESGDPDSILPVSQVEDPAPLFNDPGEFGCEGCPDTDLSTDMEITSEATKSFSGIVVETMTDGEWYIEAITGDAVAGTIETDDTGNFALEVPLFCGSQTVKLVWSNEIGSYVVISQVTRDQCTDTDIQLTLSWDDIGLDFELHLVKPEGRINDNVGLTDCTWTTCISSQPDWGVVGVDTDNPIKDVDDTGNFGPENIRLSQAENGTFSVFVEHWGAGDPEADGTVILNVSGNNSIVAEVENLPSRHVWYVGDITFPSQEVVLDGRIINCSDNWSAGCLLDLPNNVPEDLVEIQ